jgi:uncharacterized protein YndB with AHSA1/START domain
MEITVTFNVAAPAEHVSSILQDVEAWPTWTASVTKVEWVSGDPMTVGAVARIKQPGFPVVAWTVTEVIPGRSFTWEAKSPGVRSVGEHEVTPNGSGCTVRLAITQRGFLAPLLALFAGARSRRYVQMEAEGLTRTAEASLRS